MMDHTDYIASLIDQKTKMMDPTSPFASQPATAPLKPSRVVHVNFCDVCHHVWKAPAATKTCINCKGNGECARSLISYETEVTIT